MARFKILKNNRITLKENEYLIFDIHNQTMSKAKLTPPGAIYLKSMLRAENINPLQAQNYLTYRNIEFYNIVPLPFES